ncbi:TRAP transporter small permease subunit [Bordetella sp. 15P40C-2]|uniref:TRAP transporter small permease subunit n=1 Tax=Bordetella sp. 15P40C-2 TaxID=2572246 RepID=UPI001328E237|nr:TRAP transporter small permease [Bordetella sp. 15P40C-2]MVW72330.1 TRAP transporter small permease subunit [Bordetella sp. 15P40C-2]
MSFITHARLRCENLSRQLALIGVYVLLATAVLVSVDVIVRKIFNVALVGIDELGGYALALATSWALSYAFFEGAHIRVNVVHMTLPKPAKAWLDVLAVFVSAILIAVLAWQVWILAFDSWEFDAVSNTPLRVPMWIPQFLYLAGVVLFLISAILVFVESTCLVLRGKYDETIDLIEETEQAGEYTL